MQERPQWSLASSTAIELSTKGATKNVEQVCQPAQLRRLRNNQLRECKEGAVWETELTEEMAWAGEGVERRRGCQGVVTENSLNLDGGEQRFHMRIRRSAAVDALHSSACSTCTRQCSSCGLFLCSRKQFQHAGS